MLVNERIFPALHANLHQVSTFKRGNRDPYAVVTDSDGNVFRPLADVSDSLFNHGQINVVPKEGYLIKIKKAVEEFNAPRTMTIEQMVHPDVYLKVIANEYTPSEQLDKVIDRNISHGYRLQPANHIRQTIVNDLLQGKDGLRIDLDNPDGDNRGSIDLSALASADKTVMNFNLVRKMDMTPLHATMRFSDECLLLREKDYRDKHDEDEGGYRGGYSGCNLIEYRWTLITYDRFGKRENWSRKATYFNSTSALKKAIEKVESQQKANPELSYAWGFARFSFNNLVWSNLIVSYYLAVPDDATPATISSHLKVFDLADRAKLEATEIDNSIDFLSATEPQDGKVLAIVDATKVHLNIDSSVVKLYLKEHEHLDRATRFCWEEGFRSATGAECSGMSRNYYRAGILLGKEIEWEALAKGRVDAETYDKEMTELKQSDPDMKTMDAKKLFDAGAPAHSWLGYRTFLSESGIKDRFTADMHKYTVQNAMIPTFTFSLWVNLHIDTTHGDWTAF